MPESDQLLLIDDDLIQQFNQLVKGIEPGDLMITAYERKDCMVIDLDDEETTHFEFIQIGAEIMATAHASDRHVWQLQYDQANVVFFVFAKSEDQVISIVQDIKHNCGSEMLS